MGYVTKQCTRTNRPNIRNKLDIGVLLRCKTSKLQLEQIQLLDGYHTHSLTHVHICLPEYITNYDKCVLLSSEISDLFYLAQAISLINRAKCMAASSFWFSGILFVVYLAINRLIAHDFGIFFPLWLA